MGVYFLHAGGFIKAEHTMPARSEDHQNAEGKRHKTTDPKWRGDIGYDMEKIQLDDTVYGQFVIRNVSAFLLRCGFKTQAATDGYHFAGGFFILRGSGPGLARKHP